MNDYICACKQWQHPTLPAVAIEVISDTCSKVVTRLTQNLTTLFNHMQKIHETFDGQVNLRNKTLKLLDYKCTQLHTLKICMHTAATAIKISNQCKFPIDQTKKQPDCFISLILNRRHSSLNTMSLSCLPAVRPTSGRRIRPVFSRYRISMW